MTPKFVIMKDVLPGFVYQREHHCVSNQDRGDDMTAISQSKCYEIIQNFAEIIKERKVLGAKPEKTVIFFRNEAK